MNVLDMVNVGLCVTFITFKNHGVTCQGMPILLCNYSNVPYINILDRINVFGLCATVISSVCECDNMSVNACIKTRYSPGSSLQPLSKNVKIPCVTDCSAITL